MKATTTNETSDLKSTSIESRISNQQEKEGRETMVSAILKLKGIYSFFHVTLILFCLGYLTNSCCKNYQPVNVTPLYRDAIKAVDPLEKIFKNGVGSPSDRAEF